MIVDRILESKKPQLYPVHSNRASELGHECLRYLVYNRTRWQEKAKPSPNLMLKLAIGNAFETMVLRDLIDAGIQVIEQQRPFTWDKYKITGYIDAKVKIDDKIYLLEIKTCNSHIFNTLKSVESIKNHKLHYVRKYISQITLYLLLAGYEEGILLFKDTGTGNMKEFLVQLDYELAESLIKKAEAVNKHVETGTVPEPVSDFSVCSYCPFTHICLPERKADELDIITDPELDELLHKRQELKRYVEEFEEIDKKVKDKILTLEKDKLVIGKFLLEIKHIKKTLYEVPEEIKRQFATAKEYKQLKITVLEED